MKKKMKKILDISLGALICSVALVVALLILAVAIIVPIIVCSIGGLLFCVIGKTLEYFFPSCSIVVQPLFWIGFGITLGAGVYAVKLRKRKIIKFFGSLLGEKLPNNVEDGISTHTRGYVEVKEL